MKKKRGKTWAMSEAAAPMSIQLGIAQSSPAALGDRDDLTVIGGIDPVIEMALNSIGIRKLSDFAGYSPEILAQALQRRTGLAVTAEAIARQHWIVSAAFLADVSASPIPVEVQEEPAGKEAMEQSCLQSEESPIVQASQESSPIVAAMEQERANEMVAKEIISSDPECHREQLENEAGGHEIALHIRGAQFESFEIPATPDTLPENRLRVEIRCELAGIKIQALLAGEIFLCAQIHAVDTVTGECKLLASTAERLQSEQTTFDLLLAFEAPKLGSYQLHAIAFLLHPEPKIALYQGPRLRVVA